MDQTGGSITLLDLFQMGGVFMWPLLVFSILTISIAAERVYYIFFRCNLRAADLIDETRRLLDEGDFEGARKFLRKKRKKRMAAQVLFRIFEYPDLSEHRMEKNAEAEALSCIGRLENGFDYLTALGSIAPLTGFLGTVSGMIGAFKSIAEATDVNAQIVANGIYEALVTTVFGLVIAIIAMISSSLLSHTVNQFAADIETGCSEIIADISAHDN
jgi:biopolymer transport protein ExbB